MGTIKDTLVTLYVIVKVLITAVHMRVKYGSGAGSAFLDEFTDELRLQAEERNEVEKLITETEGK